MGFFKIFASLCTGTGVFIELLNAKLWRAFLHAFLMILICAFIVTAGTNIRTGGAVNKGVENFTSFTGGLSFSADSVYTGKHSGTLFEAGDFAFVNLSGSLLAKSSEAVSSALAKPAQYMVFCFDSGLLFAMTQGTREGVFRTQYIPSSVLYDVITGKESTAGLLSEFSSSGQTFTGSGNFSIYMSGLVSNIKPSSSKADAEKVEIKSADLCNIVNFSIGASTFALTFQEALLMLLLCSFSFSVAELYRMAPLKGKVNFRNILVVTIYATFPPFAIAAVYAAFDLPFFSFQITFLIAFMIYHLVGFNGIIRHFIPPPPPEERNDDDDDF